MLSNVLYNISFCLLGYPKDMSNQHHVKTIKIIISSIFDYEKKNENIYGTDQDLVIVKTEYILTGASSSGGIGLTAVSSATWVRNPATGEFTCGPSSARDQRPLTVSHMVTPWQCLCSLRSLVWTTTVDPEHSVIKKKKLKIFFLTHMPFSFHNSQIKAHLS